MTFQEAAHNILTGKGIPLDPKKIADIAFQKGMIKSKAKDPIRSFVETIKKNIRGNTYNAPGLTIIKTPNGKLFGPLG
ncbi:MAG: hypothetical protein GY864_05975 [Desulfobacterales bacterium]|nr:hypothetical protein [Desulfobacterales bacterium]